MANPLGAVATDYLVAWFHVRSGRADTPPTMSSEDRQAAEAALGRIYTRLRSTPPVADHLEALSHFPDDRVLRGTVGTAIDSAIAVDPALARDLDAELRLIGDTGGAAMLLDESVPVAPSPPLGSGFQPALVTRVRIVRPSLDDLGSTAKGFAVVGLLTALAGFAIFASGLFAAGSDDHLFSGTTSDSFSTSPSGGFSPEDFSPEGFSDSSSSGTPASLPIGFGMFFVGGVTVGIAQTVGRRRDG